MLQTAGVAEVDTDLLAAGLAEEANALIQNCPFRRLQLQAKQAAPEPLVGGLALAIAPLNGSSASGALASAASAEALAVIASEKNKKDEADRIAATTAFALREREEREKAILSQRPAGATESG